MPVVPPVSVPLEKPSVTDQCRELCQRCIELLGSSSFETEEEAIHEMRVGTKKLRSAWHLVAAIDPALAESRRNALRDLSAEIAEQRDRDVLVNLILELASEEGAKPAAFSALENSLQADSSNDLATDNGAEMLCHRIDKEALKKAWTEELAAWRSIAPKLEPISLRRRVFRNALRNSERQARRATVTALADAKADAELWHDWRKKVKRLRYQREFVAICQNRTPGVHDLRISRLGTRLGERNDLANLSSAIDSLQDLDRGHCGHLKKSVALRERAILGNAKRLGRLTFLR